MSSLNLLNCTLARLLTVIDLICRESHQATELSIPMVLFLQTLVSCLRVRRLQTPSFPGLRPKEHEQTN